MASETIGGAGAGRVPVAWLDQAMANAAMNATSQQQQNAVTSEAATTMALATLFQIDSAALGVADSGRREA